MEQREKDRINLMERRRESEMSTSSDPDSPPDAPTEFEQRLGSSMTMHDGYNSSKGGKYLFDCVGRVEDGSARIWFGRFPTF